MHLSSSASPKLSFKAIQKEKTGLVLNIHNILHKIFFLNKKKYITHWMPAHVGIYENETADTLAIEEGKLNNDYLTCVVTLNDINAVAKSRLKDKAVKSMSTRHKQDPGEHSYQIRNTLPKRDENPQTRNYKIPALARHRIVTLTFFSPVHPF